MNILIVSATQFEISFLLKKISFETILQGKEYFYSDKNININILIAGIGSVFTVYNLSEHLNSAKKNYDLVINIGIAGSFDRITALGEVVQIVEDQFADLAIEHSDGRLETFFEANFLNSNEKPFSNGVLIPEKVMWENIISLQKKKGITVNLTHGSEDTIKNFQMKYNPDIESMEGAAVFYVCMNENIPVIQIRSISNYVESRNREKWKISEAILNLNNFIFEFIHQITSNLSIIKN